MPSATRSVLSKGTAAQPPAPKGPGVSGGMKTGIATLGCTSALRTNDIAHAIVTAGATLVGDITIVEVRVRESFGATSPHKGGVDVCMRYDGYAWDVYDVLRRLRPCGVTIDEVHTENLDHGDDC